MVQVDTNDVAKAGVSRQRRGEAKLEGRFFGRGKHTRRRPVPNAIVVALDFLCRLAEVGAGHRFKKAIMSAFDQD